MKRDLIVIGGGAGGLVVASVAAQLGLRVTLIEKENKLGGDCLQYGCVPSKALLKSAHVAQAMRRANEYGFQSIIPKTDMDAVNACVKKAVDTIQVHDSHERFTEMGCEILTGEARFIDSRHVCIEKQTLSAKRFVIATGSAPWIPSIEGIDQSGYITNEDVFTLKSLPKHLMVMGAGPVGIELAQAFVNLGSRVTVIEQQTSILPRVDNDMSELLENILSEQGVNFIKGQAVTRIETKGADKTLLLSNGDTVIGDQLLVAVGRRPVVDNLALDNAGVEFSERGVKVDNKMRTTQKHIYACGDVTGLYQFTHMAEQQAGVVIANAIFRVPKKINYDVVPSVIYTEPECAQVGFSESEVKGKAGFETIRFDYSELDRAIAENNTHGFVKLIVRKGRLVGAHVIGERAGEVMHELALAISENMRLSKLTSLIHAYPSYSQINRRVAGQYFRDSLFSKKTRWIVGLLNRWLP